MMLIIVQDNKGETFTMEIEHPIKSISFETDHQDIVTRSENARQNHLLKQEVGRLKQEIKRLEKK